MTSVGLLAGWSLTIAGGPAPVRAYDRFLWSDGQALTVAGSVNHPDAVLVVFPHLARFEIDFAAREIGVYRLTDISDNTLRHLLNDQVLPRLLAHGGELVLHAAGIQGKDSAILLLGLSGQGKSTLAASFHVHGHPLLGDDAMIVGTADIAACRPVYRSLRLFSDSLAAVFEEPRARAPVADYTAKENITDLGELDIEKPTPIGAIYWLGSTRSDEIEVRRLPPAEACMTLVEHSFSLDPTDVGRSEARLRQAAALAGAVPVLEIVYPRSYSALPKVRDMILNHAA